MRIALRLALAFSFVILILGLIEILSFINIKNAGELFNIVEQNINKLIDGELAHDAPDIAESNINVKRGIKRAMDINTTVTLVAIFLSVIFGIYFSGSIGSSITKLKDSADKISKGNLSEPIKITSQDEIGELANSLDNMRYSLKLVIEEYEKIKGSEELIKNLESVQKQLMETEETYKTIFEGSNDGILVTDTEAKRIVFSNPEISKMTGYTENEFLKLEPPELFPKKDVSFIIKQLGKKHEKITIQRPIPILRKNKRTFYCQISIMPVKIAERETSLLVWFFRQAHRKKR